MSAADAPIDPNALAGPLETLIRKAKQYGADSADAIATHGRSLGIVVREGALEDVDNSEGKDIGLRVIVGKRQACVSSSDLSAASLDALAERAVAMAKLAPEDPYCGLADADLRATDTPDLDLFDDTIMSPEDLMTRALAVEAACRSVAGVTQAESCSASWATSGLYLMTSDGFAGGTRTSRHDLAGLGIASNENGMERDHDYVSLRHLSDMRDPETVGSTAGERAVKRLGGRQMESGAMPVLFDRRLTGSFVSALIGAITGTSVARGVSFLKDDLGDMIFPDHVNIIDEPHRLRGLGSRPWDGEGVRVRQTAIIDQGRLTTWLLNSAAARQLNMQPTGHAARGISAPPGISTSNTYMAAGDKSPATLMQDIGTGLYVSEMFGPSLNHNTGDYSVGVAGFAIENGEIAYPVNEITVAGNLKEMFRSIIPANDLVFESSTTAPSLLTEGLTVAGA